MTNALTMKLRKQINEERFYAPVSDMNKFRSKRKQAENDYRLSAAKRHGHKLSEMKTYQWYKDNDKFMAKAKATVRADNKETHIKISKPSFVDIYN
jgi:hypothetical protein